MSDDPVRIVSLLPSPAAFFFLSESLAPVSASPAVLDGSDTTGAIGSRIRHFR